MSYVPRALRAPVPHVFCALLALMPYMPRVLRALVPQVPPAVRALVPYVSCALRTSCPTCFLSLRVSLVPHVLSCRTCSYAKCALVPHVSRALRALVPHMLCPPPTSSPMWPRASRFMSPFSLSTLLSRTLRTLCLLYVLISLFVLLSFHASRSSFSLHLLLVIFWD